jgi:hypothetical protein
LLLVTSWAAAFALAAASSGNNCQQLRSFWFKVNQYLERLTSSLNAIDKLVAHGTVNLLSSVLNSIGSSSLKSEAGGECSGSLEGNNAGSEGHTADDVLSEERHCGDVLFCWW